MKRRRTFVRLLPREVACAALGRFGAHLREVRSRVGENQTRAAEAAGAWQHLWNRAERGRPYSLRLDQLIEFAERHGLELRLVARDTAAIAYRDEKAAAEERRRARQLDLMEAARSEYAKRTSSARRAS